MNKLFSLIVFLFFSFNALADASNKAKIVNSQLSSASGRFVFGQVSDMARDQFMLDTQTGQLWSIALTDINIEGVKKEITILRPIFYTNGALDSFSVTPERVK